MVIIQQAWQLWLAWKKGIKWVSEKEREGCLAPLLLISANGFCSAKRELYALIIRGGTEGLGMWGDDEGVSTQWKWGEEVREREREKRNWEKQSQLKCRVNNITITGRHQWWDLESNTNTLKCTGQFKDLFTHNMLRYKSLSNSTEFLQKF